MAVVGGEAVEDELPGVTGFAVGGKAGRFGGFEVGENFLHEGGGFGVIDEKTVLEGEADFAVGELGKEIAVRDPFPAEFGG